MSSDTCQDVHVKLSNSILHLLHNISVNSLHFAIALYKKQLRSSYTIKHSIQDKVVRFKKKVLYPPVSVIVNLKYLLTAGENINVCWSPDGNTIAVGNKDDLITFIDAKTHR